MNPVVEYRCTMAHPDPVAAGHRYRTEFRIVVPGHEVETAWHPRLDDAADECRRLGVPVNDVRNLERREKESDS
jgi:hypothetical protein